jgi:hypothetical protein
MWEGGSAVRNIYCTSTWKLATMPLYKLLTSPMGAHVHKTTYGPLIDRTLYARLLMPANLLLRQVGWALEMEASHQSENLDRIFIGAKSQIRIRSASKLCGFATRFKT